jgi:hypothetical protein
MTDALEERVLLDETWALEHLPGALPPRPWRIAPLRGKYYGTIVEAADGEEVCEIWMPYGPPSEREDLGDEEPCDSHYETQLAYDVCRMIVDGVNRV